MDFGPSGPRHRHFEAGLSGGRHEGGCRRFFRHYRLKTSTISSPVARSYVGLEANRQRRECAGARTAFERTFSEPYRFEYGVEGGGLGNFESRVDS
jgi:hypothetical protein